MVEKYFILKSQSFNLFKKVNDNNNSPLSQDNNNSPLSGDDNNLILSKDNNMYNEDNDQIANKYEKKINFVKVLVDDPFNNRDIILKVTKKQKGIYI